jgi:hypothetical protein
LVQVQGIVAGSVELDGVAGDEKVGGIGGLVADGLAQVEKGLAQAVAGVLLAVIRPEQTDELVAAVGLVRFDGLYTRSARTLSDSSFATGEPSTHTWRGPNTPSDRCAITPYKRGVRKVVIRFWVMTGFARHHPKSEVTNNFFMHTYKRIITRIRRL